MPPVPQMSIVAPGELARLMAGKYGTAVALSRASGVDRQTIGWLINGTRTTTSRKTAAALAEALGVPVERLFHPWKSDDSSPLEEPVLLTIPETAKALGNVSEGYVYRLIADGDLPATDIARKGTRKPKTRVPLAGLMEYVASRTTVASKGGAR